MAEGRKSRGRKYDRHWLILANLPDGIGGKRAEEIARLAGCSARTVYRDLDMLIGAGFPVEKEKTPRGTAWRLSKGFRSFPPMPFSLVDAAALSVAERRLNAAGDAYFAELVGEMLSKLRKGRGAELGRVLARLENSFVGMGGKAAAAPAVDPPAGMTGANCLPVLAQAVLERRKVSAQWRDGKGKLLRAKKLSPLRLWIVQDQAFVSALCDPANSVTTYSLKSLENVALLAETFERESPFEAEPAVGEAPARYAVPAERIQLTFGGEAEADLVERPLHPSQALKRSDGRTLCLLQAPVDDRLVHELMRFGASVLAVKPRRLGKLLAERHRAAAAAMQLIAAGPAIAEPVLPLLFE